MEAYQFFFFFFSNCREFEQKSILILPRVYRIRGEFDLKIFDIDEMYCARINININLEVIFTTRLHLQRMKLEAGKFDSEIV